MEVLGLLRLGVVVVIEIRTEDRETNRRSKQTDI